MKRILYVLVIMFIGSIGVCFFANRPNSKNQPERIKIIACFSDDVISSTSLTTQIDEINDKKIRMLLDQFDVVKLQNVFTNRYNNKGFLKPSIKNQIPENWQQIIIKDYRMAEKLVASLKREEGVLNVYIEKPLEFRPGVAPTDSEYGYQWHLHSTSSPLSDIDADKPGISTPAGMM